ncbi:MAG: S8 family serine peptidase, partial [Ilumatobacteraceae bacterium]
PPAAPAPAGGSADGAATTSPLPPTLDDDSVLVVRGDSEMRRQVRDGSLRLVTTLTEAERAAVAGAETEALAVVVIDPDGAVGPPGDHYLMTPGRLEFLGSSTTTTPAATSVGTSITTTPPVAAPQTDEHQAALLGLPGVVSAEAVTADTYAVATSGDRASIEALPGVTSVAEDIVLGLADDPGQSQQWWLENTGTADAGGTVGLVGADVNARVGWRVSRGAGTVVAVLDTGVDATHPDLIDRMWTNRNEVCGNGVDDDRNGRVDDCTGWDFGNNDNAPSPDSGVSGWTHGTHVAGIIAASANGVGVVGLAPEATIMPLKVMSTTGAISSSALYGALVYAADNGATVVNLSIATGPNTARSAASTIESGIAYARSKGVTVVAAAGNNGVDIGVQPVWPANFSLYYDNVITVAASTNRDVRASFSNYGTPVVIAAPGLHLYSTLPGATWGNMSGTSMATPAVAGAVADLVASPLSSGPSTVRARLVGTAKVTAIGPRLDLGAALGGDDTRLVRATYEGANTLVADQTGTLGVRLQATQVPPGVAGVRMHLATLVGGQVYAVASLPAVVSTTAGSTPVTSGDDGAFTVALTDTSALASTTGLRLDLAMELPAGDFAVVTELVDATGAVAGGTSVGYLTVSTPATDGGTTTTAAPGPNAPSTTSAPGTTVAGPGTTVAGPTTTASAGTGTTAPKATTTTAPGNTAPGTTQAPGTTAPGTTQAPGTTAAPWTTSPGTTLPDTTSPGTTAPGTTSPAPGTTTATTAPGTTPPDTTTPGTTTPGTTAPEPTTPPPDPDSSGPWRVDSMSPRLATIDGGTTVTLNGVFPTTVPVFVWFGELAIVQAVSTGSTLTVQTPAVPTPAITDVSVRFRTNTTHTLTLADAFTFIDRSPSTNTTTTVVEATTTTSGGGGGGGTAPTTTSRGTGTTAPGTTAPGTTAPGTTAPGTTAPGTTAPGSTTPIAVTTTTPAPPPTLGSLTLRPAPGSGSLARLSGAAWPMGCRTASCSSSQL